MSPLARWMDLPYRAGAALHRGAFLSGLLPRASLDRFTVSVGSLHFGGAGKTPLALDLLTGDGALLMRGYRGEGATSVLICEDDAGPPWGRSIAADGERRTAQECSARFGDEAVMAAGEALMSKDQAPAHVIEQAVPLYAEQLAGRKSRDEAAAALIKAAGMSQNAAVSAAMLVRAARIHLAMHHEAKAEKLLALVLRTYAPRTRGSAVRQARIALGDVWRLRGNYQKARDLYQQAGPARAVIGKSVIITKGDFARHVEAYVKSSEFAWAEQYLDKWEDAYPTDKLEGYSTLLRVRLLEAHRKHAEAAAEAETLADVNPASNYAAELLMHAAKAYRRLGMPAKSKPLLERIIGDYPESAFAAEAKQMGK